MSRKSKRTIDFPSGAQALDGSSLALANAERHLRCANLLKESEEIGVASGHLVLALEEGVKAWVLCFMTIGMPFPDSFIYLVLTNHGFRHGIAGINLLINLYNNIIDRNAINAESQYPNPTDEEKKTMHDVFVQGLIEEMTFLANHADDEKDPISAQFYWIKNANETKNSAFYVDFHEGEWKTPTDVSEDQFERGYNVTKDLLNGISKLCRYVSGISIQERKLLESNLRDEFSSFIQKLKDQRTIK